MHGDRDGMQGVRDEMQNVVDIRDKNLQRYEFSVQPEDTPGASVPAWIYLQQKENCRMRWL